MRASRLNPRLSAKAQLNGALNFNQTPLAPPGTRDLIHEKPKVQMTWGNHSVDVWYIGPTQHHY
eukprot:736667-Ditylum_brightwellii.AAC.1